MIKVVIVGETCTDRFIYCTANRICPEAPVPVLEPISIKTNPGMAGNTSENIKALLPDARIKIYTQSVQINKTRYVEKKSNQMFIRVDEGEKNVQSLVWNESFEKDLIQADIVIVSDYNKGFLTDEHLSKIGQLSKLSILDSKRRLNTEVYRNYNFIKLNEKEYNSNQHLEHQGVIVTLGSAGSTFRGKTFPSPSPQETIDVSGAGDTFTAAFIVKYFQTKLEDTSIVFANEMASKVVSKRGVVPCF
jgi:bifunctional ADP-heptose synthase (sugar kinase/adenylyltransferase)